MFDVRRLLVLRQVVQCGSLTAAAAVLNYTTSAVSQQISALERELGQPLLVRGPFGVQPTQAGTVLLEHSARILSAVSAAEAELTRLHASGEVLRVATFASVAATLLPGPLVRLRTANPSVALELVSADPDDGVALLRHGEVEAAFVTSVPAAPPEYEDVHVTPAYDDEFLVVLPVRHRLAAAAEVPLRALASEQWLVSSATGKCPDTKVFRAACRHAGFTPSVTFRSEDYGAVVGLVGANAGVSMVPSLAAPSTRPDVVLRRVAGPKPVRRIGIATARPPADGSVLGLFVGLVRSMGSRWSGVESAFAGRGARNDLRAG